MPASQTVGFASRPTSQELQGSVPSFSRHYFVDSVVMLQLFLMRHAKSDWSNSGMTDHDRPLNRRGMRNAPAMGSFLAKQDVVPEVVYCSTAVRARQTADMLLPTFAKSPDVLFSRELYLATLEQLCDHLSRTEASVRCGLVIGHNPGLSRLASFLSGEVLELPTAAVVHLQVDAEHWADVMHRAAWQAVNFWKPREVLKTIDSD